MIVVSQGMLDRGVRVQKRWAGGARRAKGTGRGWDEREIVGRKLADHLAQELFVGGDAVGVERHLDTAPGSQRELRHGDPLPAIALCCQNVVDRRGRIIGQFVVGWLLPSTCTVSVWRIAA